MDEGFRVAGARRRRSSRSVPTSYRPSGYGAHPQSCQPSPIWLSGRPAHRPFRGLLGVHSRYGLHTRAVTVSRDTLIRRLQPFRFLHSCSGCFRLEPLPGGTRTHWKAPPLHGARQAVTRIMDRKFLRVRAPKSEWLRHIHRRRLRLGHPTGKGDRGSPRQEPNRLRPRRRLRALRPRPQRRAAHQSFSWVKRIAAHAGRTWGLAL